MKQLCLIMVFLCTSCATNLSYKSLGELETSKRQKSKSDKFVYYSKKEKSGDYSKFQKHRHNTGLQCYINKEFKKRNVKHFLRKPTYVESLTKDRYKDIDHNVELLVSEDIKKESSWSKVLRAITLGFYPQKIKKKVSLTIKSKKEVVKREFDMSANVYAPFNIVPLDFNNSVFVLRDESERYAKEFYEMLNIR